MMMLDLLSVAPNIVLSKYMTTANVADWICMSWKVNSYQICPTLAGGMSTTVDRLAIESFTLQCIK